MKKHRQASLSQLIAISWMALAASTGFGADEKVLWQIGQSDHSDAEFALAPDGFHQFKEDGVFFVGESDAKRDWPYVQPGPSDAWAGRRQHTFAILFDLTHAPESGDGLLQLDLVDTQIGAPNLHIEINGTAFDRALDPGSGQDSVQDPASRGKAQSLKIPFPASLLRAGENDVEITTTRGSWMLYDSVALTAPATAELGKTHARTIVERVQQLPVLQDRDGKSIQTLVVTVRHYAPAADGSVGFAGGAAMRVHLTKGSQSIEFLTPAVSAETSRTLEVKEGNQTVATLAVAQKPVRPLTVYMVPHSHTDIGYTVIQTEVEKKQMNNLLLGMAAARRTADYPPGARFIWNVEVLWAVDLFLHRMDDQQKAEFMDAVKKGQVVLNGTYANELTGLCRPEELIQLFHYATELSQQTGVPIESAMISDVPGYTWGTVAAMAQAGIKYYSAGPNHFDRIGTIMRDCENRPFYWEAPDSQTKILTWVPFKGYGYSHIYHQMSMRAITDLCAEMDRVQFPYDIVYVRWSGHGDNAVPDPDICDFVRDWNANYTSPKFIISGTTEAFRAFEKRYAKQIPVLRGDWTPYWEDGAASSALESAMNRNSADRLVQAEAIWSMLGRNHYPAAAFGDAWRNVLLYSEHTWGASMSITAPESQKTAEQWVIKKGFADQADQQSRQLLAASLSPVTAADPPSSQVDVFNSVSWTRSGLVTVPADASSAGDQVRDEDGKLVSSQRLKSGELVFLAQDMPPLAARRYTISAGAAQSAGRATAEGAILDNGIVHVRVDEKTGGIIELTAKDVDGNLVDTNDGQSLNDYLYLPGADLKDLQHNGAVTISAGESGPLVASLIIESDAPGCHKLRRELRVVAGQDYVELTDLVDKARLQATDYKLTKESINLAFPFNVPDGDMLLDIPLGAMRPEIDQIPGSCKNWYPVGRWVDISNPRQGVTWVTLDAPLVEVGDITATLLNSQTNPEIWRQHVGRTQRLYCWAMNNHWGTNYRAYQEGPVSFRFIVRPHRKSNPADATRFAIGFSQPLLPVRSRAGKPLSAPMFTLSSDDVVVNTLKPSDDGKGWIVRLFGAAGKKTAVKLSWPSSEPHQLWLSDTSEKPLRKIHGSVMVPAWGLVTLRAD